MKAVVLRESGAAVFLFSGSHLKDAGLLHGAPDVENPALSQLTHRQGWVSTSCDGTGAIILCG